jgi:hypothetical protein
MTVERFYDAMLRREAGASVELDGETWSLPRFQLNQQVFAAGRAAVIVGYVDYGKCGAHPDQYRYQVRFHGTGDNWNPWPYCESQLEPND